MALDRNRYGYNTGGDQLVAVQDDLVADSADNQTFIDRIGMKTDASVSVVSETASLMAYIKGVMAQAGQIVQGKVTTLIANGETSLFDISGDVAILDIWGVVGTIIQAAATDYKLVFDPTVAGADVDLCAVLDINADAVGTRYRLTGDISDAMIATLNMVESSGYDMGKSPIHLSAGKIHANSSAARTGVIAWYVRYISLGGIITATA